MTKKTLSIRTGEPGQRAARKTWGLTGERLERARERARTERRSMTEAELFLWERIGGGRVGGLQFSRKLLVGSVLADFACPSRWLVVNVTRADANAEFDALQDRKLTEAGVRVLRFAESEVLADRDAVVAAIQTEANQPFDRRTARARAATRFERAEG